MKNQKLRDELNGYGRPMVSISEIASAMGLTPAGLHMRLRELPPEEHPPLMNAGGQRMAITSSAIPWCEQHLAKYPRRAW